MTYDTLEIQPQISGKFFCQPHLSTLAACVWQEVLLRAAKGRSRRGTSGRNVPGAGMRAFDCLRRKDVCGFGNSSIWAEFGYKCRKSTVALVSISLKLCPTLLQPFLLPHIVIPYHQAQKHTYRKPKSLRMGTLFQLLLIAVLALAPQLALSQTNYCCNAPNFGSDWCHSSSCLGAGCRNEPDPITGESQSNYLCDDLSSCVCAGGRAQPLQLLG